MTVASSVIKDVGGRQPQLYGSMLTGAVCKARTCGQRAGFRS